ncbi:MULTISPECIES: SOS response-associated peptidase [unclassified Rossellomorea]|uniref:SOS response-associated peptidase n=1 Tax=unclassified Rossellomorea TaxID=2837526 RepID=UPI0020C6683A|nr:MULTISPECIES: SOS response-associated peptidase [unclassified Rossellomorea]UTE76064.1 SOS response-associated peptidase [Rossellomorea sp. KS-H15a]WGG43900.1 SOS response-associated peptidase [Rossellomorea sp. DA94]
MCGRFSLTTPLEELVKLYLIDEFLEDWQPRYNIAPSQNVLSLISHKGKRRAGEIKWGLVPHWADASKWKPLINARSETLLVKPSFKSLVHSRRMVIFADGFYEWKKEESGRIPIRFKLKEEQPFVFAGLWDRNGEVTTSTILTTEANSLVEDVHERMPVMLTNSEDIEKWLNTDEYSFDQAASVLKPLPREMMEGYRVSTYVNSPKHDTSECIVPVSSVG